MQLISHLRHHISGAPFLLIQALPSSREDTCLCTCLQNSRHANGATKIPLYKRVPENDLGYIVPPLQTREYDIYCCLNILHLVHCLFGQDAEKGPSVKKKASSLAQHIITKDKLHQQPEICHFLSFMKFHFTRWQHLNRTSIWRALEDIS